LFAAIAKCANGYDQLLVEVNGLRQNNFGQWLFHPGMLFDAPQKWWGDLGARDFPHEGIDFCLYRNSAGQAIHLDQRSMIPAMADGVVRSIFKDFLGRAIVVEHPQLPLGNGQALHSVYAHTTPRPGLGAGSMVRRREAIATIAGTGHLKSGIRPHLHFTVARPRHPLPYDSFYWNIMRDPEQVTLLDPAAYFRVPPESLPPTAPS
jgi:murein DD-endopeptidase MepM/ murein hydrolase activator NlpD